MRYCGSQGSLVPRPKEREQAHSCSHSRTLLNWFFVSSEYMFICASSFLQKFPSTHSQQRNWLSRKLACMLKFSETDMEQPGTVFGYSFMYDVMVTMMRQCHGKTPTAQKVLTSRQSRIMHSALPNAFKPSGLAIVQVPLVGQSDYAFIPRAADDLACWLTVDNALPLSQQIRFVLVLGVTDLRSVMPSKTLHPILRRSTRPPLDREDL